MKLKSNILRFVIALVLCQGAGLVGSIFTFSAITNWYAYLNKPFFNPPNWLFGPAWFLLYTLMAIALFLVWRKGLENKKVSFAFWFFIVHLVVNALWSVIFFGLQNPFFALFDIVIMWLMIAYLIFLFSKIDKKAAWLMVPYILWVTFATALNFAVWRLN